MPLKVLIIETMQVINKERSNGMTIPAYLAGSFRMLRPKKECDLEEFMKNLRKPTKQGASATSFHSKKNTTPAMAGGCWRVD